ncbi:hypothetical protein BAE44_0016625 [Dichanthelium oligosanthes]|uniref:Uncharacterized protein n=1 Tax=Dichanthelium oligosanthes TaxID=888268 RepID=A0A1E5VB26_9POAL|nr:hypothetical protein BAE44_0016625 [Dichanthelium oligosanthes]
MLRLHRRILSRLLSPPSPSAPSISPIFPFHRLLSSTAAPFAAEDYLVTSCGLTRAQAVKASKKLSHVKSPSKPDSVLAFLADLGLSRADVAAVVSKDPGFLLADVERTLAPRVVKLGDLGLSRSQIVRLVIACHKHLRRNAVLVLHRNIEFWVEVFGSLEGLLRVLKVSNSLLSINIEKLAKPNLALLQQCGISPSDLPSRFMDRMLCRSTKHLQESLARVDEFGIEHSSWVFPYVFWLFAIFSHEKLNMNLRLLEKLGWSKDDISSAVSRAPHLLGLTEEKVRRNLDFLTGDVGLDIPYIARRPVLMLCSVEQRLLPRYSLMNILKARRLLNAEYSFYFIIMLGKETFLHRFVHPYEESVPGLTAAYASSCAGKPQWELLSETIEEKRKI